MWLMFTVGVILNRYVLNKRMICTMRKMKH